jgi:hypothetical protein
VEDALVVLQIGVPARMQPFIMSNEERKPPHETYRRIRDWGILNKYRAYLHRWRKLLSKVEEQRNKQKARQQKFRRKNKIRLQSTTVYPKVSGLSL